MKKKIFEKHDKLLKDIYEYAEHLRTHGAPDVASKLIEIAGGRSKKWNDEFIENLVREGTEEYDRYLNVRGSRPRVVGLIVTTIDYLSEHKCTWESLDLAELATDIEDWAGR